MFAVMNVFGFVVVVVASALEEDQSLPVFVIPANNLMRQPVWHFLSPGRQSSGQVKSN